MRKELCLVLPLMLYLECLQSIGPEGATLPGQHRVQGVVQS